MSKRSFYGSGPGAGTGFQRATQRVAGARKVAFTATRRPVVQTGHRGRGVAGFQRTSGFYGRFAPIAGGSQELKFLDLDIDDAVVASGGTIQTTGTVNAIAQNVTESGRVGRKCVIRSIGWRFQVTIPETIDSASPPNPDVCRVILYLDKQCNGATAIVTGILESADFQSFNNLANKGRFRTLMDRVYAMNYSQLTNAQNADTFEVCAESVQDTFFKNCTIPIEFDNTTGAITEIRSNNIGVLIISRSGLCGFASKMRLRFSDA